jgi:endonuclease/exonuclease/phosphatase (EEP) superfamily protein YafD
MKHVLSTDGHGFISARQSSALRTLTILLALAYPIALAAIILAFRYVGERWWVTLVAMYLPRIGFALPLPFVVIAVLLWGSRRLMALQGLSILLIVFPLMGLTPGTGRLSGQAAGPVIRLVSYNVGLGALGIRGVVAQIRELSPDLVLLQDASANTERDLREAFDGWEVRLDGQFFVASRYPILDAWNPPLIIHQVGTGTAHFVRYTLQTPLGVVDVFNTHPTSPRQGLEEVRGSGLREEILSGRLLAGKASRPVELNAYRRQRQVESLAAAAGTSPHPVIIAGDTNLPGLSWVLAERLGRFRDAFSEAGLGFGYTFPARRPWMRIDRILTNGQLRAVDFRVGDAVASDHRCVFAILGGVQ